MKRNIRFGILCAGLAFVGVAIGVRPGAAQTKEARGTVIAVSDSSLTVKVAQRDLAFAVDASTLVEAAGAGRETRKAREAGGTGIKITEFIQPGRAVSVTYREVNGANRATSVRHISTAGPGGGSTSDEAAKIAHGKVKSVTASALTLTSDGKDLAFVVDADTNVKASGAGTATRKAGGRSAITELVGNGDTVSVTYRKSGAALNASEVFITVKAR